MLSLAPIAASMVALAVQGLNLGIDFKGGVQVTSTTPQPTSLAGGARGGAARRGRPGHAGLDRRTVPRFQIRLRELAPAEQATLKRDLASSLGAEVRA